MFHWLLHTGYLNAVLRASPDSSVTVFRLLFPIAVAIKALTTPVFRNEAAFFAVLFLTSQFFSFLVSGYVFTFFQFGTMVNYLFMGLLFIYLTHDTNRTKLYRHLELNYCFLVALLLAQSRLGFVLPNTDESAPAVNGWFWNENDASLALGAFLFLSIWYGMRKYLIPFHISAVYLMYLNGSRAALGGIGLYILAVYLSKPNKSIYHKIFDVFVVLFLIGAGFLYYEFGNYNRDLFYLSLEPIVNLLTLTEYNFPLGSVQWRTQVSVLGIKDLIDSYFLGIGAGSTFTLIGHNYYLGEHIQSMHNLFLQIFVEFGGVLSVILVIYVKRKSPLDNWRFLLIFGVFSVISLGQSGGILTNYSAMVGFFYCLLVTRKDFAKRYSPARRIGQQIRIVGSKPTGRAAISSDDSINCEVPKRSVF